MTWQEEFEIKLNAGDIKTNSDIEDFIGYLKYEKLLPESVGDVVWKYFYEWQMKGTPCEGCIHSALFQLGNPCTMCIRRPDLEDHYKRRV